MTAPRSGSRGVGGTGPRLRNLLALAVIVVCGAVWFLVQDRESGTDQSLDPVSGLPWVEESQLPAEAVETLGLIDAGGPYPYDRDDITFGNFEGILPERPRGHYREYTVRTPGIDHRGPRRIVAGAEDEYYWTEDHYESFERIRR